MSETPKVDAWDKLTRLCVYCKQCVEPETSYYWHKSCKIASIERENATLREQLATKNKVYAREDYARRLEKDGLHALAKAIRALSDKDE